jgi:hypothetical protein
MKLEWAAWSHREPYEVIRGSIYSIVTEDYKKSHGARWRSHRGPEEITGGKMESWWGYKKSHGPAWSHRKPHEVIRGSIYSQRRLQEIIVG